MQPLHVISFSSGLSSALTGERAIARYGAHNCVVLFCDTLIEDDDNYRFALEMFARWRARGVMCHVLADGRDPYQVAEAEHVIPNNWLAPCTARLKTEIFTAACVDLACGWPIGSTRRWTGSRQLAALRTAALSWPRSRRVVVHIGYDYAEMHRCEAVTRGYGSYGFEVDFPLLWKPLELRDYAQAAREDWNIEPPRMYALGYSHANCGGQCCKQGQGDWLRTLLNFPARFDERGRWEERMRENPKHAGYALLREQRGGEYSPLPLSELRERYEAKQAGRMFDLDTLLGRLDEQAGCVRCGVGDLICEVEEVA